MCKSRAICSCTSAQLEDSWAGTGVWAVLAAGTGLNVNIDAGGAAAGGEPHALVVWGCVVAGDILLVRLGIRMGQGK